MGRRNQNKKGEEEMEKGKDGERTGGMKRKIPLRNIKQKGVELLKPINISKRNII